MTKQCIKCAKAVGKWSKIHCDYHAGYHAGHSAALMKGKRARSPSYRKAEKEAVKARMRKLRAKRKVVKTPVKLLPKSKRRRFVCPGI